MNIREQIKDKENDLRLCISIISDEYETIRQLRKELAELKEQADKEKEWPQNGDVVWWLTTDGDIDTTWCNADLKSNDREILVRGYFFKTKEEAEEADRKRVAEIAYKNKIKEVNGDWKPNWTTWNRKRYLYLHNASGEIAERVVIGSFQVLDDSEYFAPHATPEQINELKRLYAEWKGIDYE